MTEADSEAEANYQATMNCKCEKAIEFKRVEEMKEAAYGNVDVLFQDQPEGMIAELKNTVDLIAERRIHSATFKISSRISATVGKGKDSIVIKRKYTEENTMES